VRALSPAIFRAGAALTLGLLLVHAWVYGFQCDDAFISFRYARNLAHGHGLVFNPGLERVEGYTNFLWVVLLATLDRFGIRPEWGANLLSLTATVALWACVVWSASRGARPAGALALVPALFLAGTRSVAVWSTSGLETRLFELLIVCGVLRLGVEIEPAPAGQAPRRPLAGWLFGLSALTRPEGILLGASALLVAAWIARSRGRSAVAWLAATLGPFAALVLAHFIFRRAYYGEWLPNTYYAKVGGHLRWNWGFGYLGAFALEYGVLLWLPLLVVGARQLRRTGRGHVAALFAAVTAPLLVYVAAVGGDHFEYRPLDVLFPIAFLVVGEGMVALARRRRIAAVVAAIAIAFALVDLPLRSHLEYPPTYVAGFPGLAVATSEPARDFLAPERDPVLGLPGLGVIASAHRSLVRYLSSHFVGLRQEEQKGFLEYASAQGRLLRGLVDRGVLPRDARIATDCVGAIPYLSDLLVLDRHGLTDKVIARRPADGDELLAHERSATLEDARRFGVELWAVGPVDLVEPITSPHVLYAMSHPVQGSLPVYTAIVEPDGVLLSLLPMGAERVAARMPGLRFHTAADTVFARAYLERATPAFQERLRQHPDDAMAMDAFAYIQLAEGRAEEALPLYEELTRLAPDDPGVWEKFAACQQALHRPAEERTALERSLALAQATGDGTRAARVAARLQALPAAH